MLIGVVSDSIKIALFHGEFREIPEALTQSGKYDIVFYILIGLKKAILGILYFLTPVPVTDPLQKTNVQRSGSLILLLDNSRL